MKKKMFEVWMQMYICKNIDKLPLLDIAAFIDCEIEEVKDEYNRLKATGLAEQYKGVSDEEITLMRQETKKTRGRPKGVTTTVEKENCTKMSDTSKKMIEIPLEEYIRLQWEAGFSAGMLHILELE